MGGGKVATVEQRGKYELCCYGSPGFPGWAVFEFKPTKPDEPDWKSVINGTWSDVWKKYVDLAVTRS